MFYRLNLNRSVSNEFRLLTEAQILRTNSFQPCVGAIFDYSGLNVPERLLEWLVCLCGNRGSDGAYFE